MLPAETQMFFSAIYMITFCSALVWTQDCHCGLPGTVVKFKDCRRKSAAWRRHDHPDINLTGDCLPRVPENTMRCFKWRTAEDCSADHHLRCSLRNRFSAEVKVRVGPHGHSATLLSPSYNRTSNPFYLNNNFCIYNISLNCPGEKVSLTSKLTDYGLSDGDTCQDYLWLDTSSSGQPQNICGDDIIDFRDSLSIQSFIGVLWSNGNNSEGKFEIEARCTGHPVPTTDPGSSGDVEDFIV